MSYIVTVDYTMKQRAISDGIRLNDTTLDSTIKQYIDAFGNFEGQYVFVKSDIFKQENILPYTKKFNPEKLI